MKSYLEITHDDFSASFSGGGLLDLKNVETHLTNNFVSIIESLEFLEGVVTFSSMYDRVDYIFKNLDMFIAEKYGLQRLRVERIKYTDGDRIYGFTRY